ncbi:MAG TPA: tetratricopeptide repeat protein, partial [Candidatus Sulfotelmatobacter sp.]|nr:tetratricopeptide repeat protein [Candidatus Sulfotelmatobacter sp.]
MPRLSAVSFGFLCIAFSISSANAQSCGPAERFDECPKTPANFARLLDQAHTGDPFSQFQAGLAYETGAGTERNYIEAAHWYRLAADHGTSGAQNNLGGLYSRGLGVQQDDREALKWYLRAASDGYPAAQNNVGFMYANGRGTVQDVNVAFNWYRKAAEKGYAAAENNL